MKRREDVLRAVVCSESKTEGAGERMRLRERENQ